MSHSLLSVSAQTLARCLVPLLILALPNVAAAQWETNITRVIQLGDSYSAGYGVLDPNVPVHPEGQTHCDDPKYQAVAFTPGFRLAAHIETQADHLVDYHYAACGGAEVYYSRRDLATQWQDIKDEVPNLGTGEGTLIVMTFGGNDVRSNVGWDWPTAVEYCIKLVPTSECGQYPNNYLIQVENLEEIALEFAVTLADIVAEVPEAVVRVLGYPIPFQPEIQNFVIPTPSPLVIPLRRCKGMTGLSADEADFLDGEAGALNDHLQMAVELADQTTVVDMEFVDVEGLFRGHGACNVDDPFVNDVDWVNFKIQANSMHPLAPGWDAYYQALLGSMN